MITIRNASATAPQDAFWRSPAKFRLMVGGVGSGKTHAGCLEVLRQPPGSIGVVLAPTYPMLMDATIRSLLDLLERSGVPYEYRKSAPIQITLAGNRTILPRSADRPDRLRGPNLNWFYADEAAMMPGSVWDIMLGRLRLTPSRAWATSTPRGQNWLYELFAASENPAYAMIKAPTRTNVYLPEDFADTLEQRYDAGFAAQELEGEFLSDPTGRLLLDDWLKLAATAHPNATPGDYDPIRDGPRRISCDPSEGRGADRSAILVRDDRRTLHLEASKTMGPEGAALRINELRHEWKVGPNYISFDGGGGAGRDMDLYLRRYGIIAKRVMGAGSGGPRYANLRSAAAWRFRDAVRDGFGLARAGSHLKALTGELTLLTYHRTGDKDALIRKEDLAKVLGHSPDLADVYIQSYSYN
jgi:hypothetical protein